jgi:hypothetical protein
MAAYLRSRSGVRVENATIGGGCRLSGDTLEHRAEAANILIPQEKMKEQGSCEIARNVLVKTASQIKDE